MHFSKFYGWFDLLYKLPLASVGVQTGIALPYTCNSTSAARYQACQGENEGGGIDTKSNGYCNLSMSRSQYLFAIKKTKAGESNGCFDHVTLYHTVYKLVYMGPSLQGILRPGLYF